MTAQTALIRRKLRHLRRMREYLCYSRQQMSRLPPLEDWSALKPEDHESLAAFRVRFGDFQEHLGKAMRAVALEEEQRTEPYTAVFVYIEKLGIIDSVGRWKEIRELRNAINHEYEDDIARLGALFAELTQSVPELLDWHDRLIDFCRKTYGESDN